MPMEQFVYWAEREVSDANQLVRLVAYHVRQVTAEERERWLDSSHFIRFSVRFRDYILAMGELK